MALIISLLGCVSVSDRQSATPATMLAEIQMQHGIPALGIVALSSREILTIEVEGVTNIETRDPVAKEAFFHLGSNKKAITAYIAGKLVDEGKLAWDSKLLTIIPELASSAKDVYASVTLADLLSHRARVQPFVSGAEFENIPEMEGTVREQRISFASYALKQEPVSLVARRYMYSNAGYVMAAAMIEQASANSWENLVAQYIGDELGLKYLFGWPNVKSESQPWGHMTGAQVGDPSRNLVPLGPDFPYKLQDFLAPAGNMSMSLPDYAFFVQGNLQGLRGSSDLLSPGTFEYIHSGIPKYALGWENLKRNGDMVSTHDGSAGTFYCHTVIVPERDLAVIVVANSATPKTIEGMYKLRDNLIRYYKKRGH